MKTLALRKAKVNAIEENKKIAAESGNKLTQNITPEGNLVGVANMNTQEENIKLDDGDSISTADIKKELFEGDNIVTSLNTDKGLSNLDGTTFTLDSASVEESKGE